MNIFILAGEPSGDEYGAALMRCMQFQNPEISFHGIGGPLMTQYGLKSMADFNKMSVMGFVEVLTAIPSVAGVVHDATGLWMPLTSTTQRRQAPNASSLGS